MAGGTLVQVTSGRKLAFKKGTRPRTRRMKMYKSLKSPAPYKMTAKLAYQEVVSLNPSAIADAVHRFSANGMFDPNLTGIGHQPRGFDQYMAMFDHFVVIGVKIKCIFVGIDDSAQASMIVGVALKDSATTYTSNDYMEGRTCNYAVLEQNSFGYPSQKTIVMKANPNRFLGRSKPLSDSQLKGSITANPAEDVQLHIFASTLDGVTDPSTFNVNVLIEYTAVFIEPKTPAQS